MQIISHRGWWKSSDEKNQLIAFQREFQYCSDLASKSYRGGVETDLRDYNGSLVISHDIATQDSLSLDKFFSLYSDYNIYTNSTLALNIKADGLQVELKSILQKYKILGTGSPTQLYAAFRRRHKRDTQACTRRISDNLTHFHSSKMDGSAP